MLTTTTLLVVSAVLFSAFLRGMAGFGFSLAAVPIISLVLSPVDAVAIGVMLQVIIGLREVFVLKGNIHKPSLTRLTLGSLIGTPIGVIALTALSPDGARILIALAILAGLAMIMRNKPTVSHASNGLAVAAGIASGAFSGLAAIPGPPAVAYYLGTGIDTIQTRASLMLFFFFASLLAMPGLIIAGAVNANTLWLSAISFPALAAGTWLGTEAFKRLDNAQYRNLAIIVMAVSAVLSGWRGVSAYL
ncbi:sulfite exporter TauE/SafE family protein [Loktanella sp. D2R18]|uniref:sulfite exporter TauE/SafE family protein n=1 Tax=Rhodobacterales TaxID=204455 RepID=UPI000DEA9489|nr:MULTISPECIES: sulfite exporter TauE/SafE family protein [Rhodobacterales]MDO6592139.1 sulfite exporter TauE/SafE family protein [Yoonia sp. 1_MG-2023]RBW42719.1 sulfite exporter TauE/SafE family protein [Loktanella sp. D2R18]